MATRSYVIEWNESAGTFRGVYHHWSGAPEWNGRMLLDHYSDQAKLSRLIDMGACSVLAADIGNGAHPFSEAYEYSERAGVSTFYHRDRGDAWERVEPRESADLLELINRAVAHTCDYVYLYAPESGRPARWRFRPVPFNETITEADQVEWYDLAGYLARTDAEAVQ